MTQILREGLAEPFFLPRWLCRNASGFTMQRPNGSGIRLSSLRSAVNVGDQISYARQSLRINSFKQYSYTKRKIGGISQFGYSCPIICTLLFAVLGKSSCRKRSLHGNVFARAIFALSGSEDFLTTAFDPTKVSTKRFTTFG
jgi:hypothetical protein